VTPAAPGETAAVAAAAGEPAALAAAAAVAGAYASEWARVVSTLIRITGDWSLAEECTADAFEAALKLWPTEGVPRTPGAWLTTVAKNKALDRLRRATTEKRKLTEVATMHYLQEPTDDDVSDDRLRLIFTCCHPALAMEARVALTLRTVAGLTTPEIAAAFLVPEATMAQRIVRAKRKITNAGIPYRVPTASALPERLGGVLAVLYLLYGQGYSARRVDLAAEAIRLTRLLVDLMPNEAEALGLLSLMLLQHSRRDARVDDAGDLVTLEDQDRALWHRDEIDDGLGMLRRASRLDGAGAYFVQAAMAAVHARAASFADTDTGQLVSLYDTLLAIAPSPVVELNRAIAVGMRDGAAAGLSAVEAAATALPDFYLVPAARADFLRRLERLDEAAVAYQEAAEIAPTEADRRFLAKRLAEVTTGTNRRNG
jgi:RNA polymerase sigma-70 factor, ECF subfamily